MTVQLVGAAALGVIIGWYVYYVNRYRKGEVQFSDLTTLIGIIGGGGATQIIGDTATNKAEMFGAYGIGLFIGFFGYLIVLMVLVRMSDNFNSDWFLDGRRKDPTGGYSIPGEARRTIAPMDFPAAAAPPAASGLTAQTIIVNAAAGTGEPEADVAPSNKANEIIAQCESVWNANKGDCNAFAKAVASAFGVTLNGDANGIVDQISSEPGWTKANDGPAAKAAAEAGNLVIGGRKDTPHGHVVVVVSGPLANGKYPTAYWGSLGGVGRKSATINYAWRVGERDQVVYYARAV
jgi:hypothetical protein